MTEVTPTLEGTAMTEVAPTPEATPTPESLHTPEAPSTTEETFVPQPPLAYSKRPRIPRAPSTMTLEERHAAIKTLAIPPEKLPVFSWTGSDDYQAFTQYMPIFHLPDGALQVLALETTWVEEAFDRDYWEKDTAIAVGLNQQECPFCLDHKSRERPYHGAVTGLKITKPRACSCLVYKLFYPTWFNPANVPLDYRHVWMGKLLDFRSNFGTFITGPQSKSLGLENLIETVKKYRHNCYLLAGPAGTGKTTLMLAMYQQALMEWAIECFNTGKRTQSVWKVNATTLAKQFRDWSMRGDREDDPVVPPPDITEKKVLSAIRAGLVPRLFIDELDKFKMDSSFQASEFSEVIGLIQASGGQVVATSNLGIPSLCTSLGEQFGPAIVRRLCGARMNASKPQVIDDPEVGGFHVNFWAGTIEQNYKITPPGSEKPLPVKKVWIPEAEYQRQRNESAASKYPQTRAHTYPQHTVSTEPTQVLESTPQQSPRPSIGDLKPFVPKGPVQFGGGNPYQKKA